MHLTAGKRSWGESLLLLIAHRVARWILENQLHLWKSLTVILLRCPSTGAEQGMISLLCLLPAIAQSRTYYCRSDKSTRTRATPGKAGTETASTLGDQPEPVEPFRCGLCRMDVPRSGWFISSSSFEGPCSSLSPRSDPLSSSSSEPDSIFICKGWSPG